jgi:hypothetical protein
MSYILIATQFEQDLPDCVQSAMLNKEAFYISKYNPTCSCNKTTYSNVCVLNTIGLEAVCKAA